MTVKRTGRLCLAIALAVPLGAAAGDMYKWQDADGLWHFSDQPPEHGQSFDTFQVEGEPQPMVTMRQEGPERSPTHVFFNRYYGPAQIELHLTESENVRSDPPLPARFVLPGQTEQALVSFRPVDERQGFRYRLAYKLVPGPPAAELPTDLDFYPPFPDQDRFPISQGIDDARTHLDDGNRYAVDIAMPIGSPVLAARGGKVMEVEDDFHDKGKPDPRYISRANQIRILHDDGTMAVYAHLQANSARVLPGARVEAGQWIANSGNTGYSTGPHLHFAVQMNIGMQLESLPFRFKVPGGGVMDPAHPQWLVGVLPMPR